MFIELGRFHRAGGTNSWNRNLASHTWGRGKSAIQLVEFAVMKMPSPYNGILERQSLAAFEAVISVKDQMIKFSTENGIREVRSD